MSNKWRTRTTKGMLKNTYGKVRMFYPNNRKLNFVWPKKVRAQKKFSTYDKANEHAVYIVGDLWEVNHKWYYRTNSRWRAVRNAYNGVYK